MEKYHFSGAILHFSAFSMESSRNKWPFNVQLAVTEETMCKCTVDGISSGAGFKGGLLKGAAPAKQDAWLVALNTTLAALRAAVGDDKVLLQNSHSGWPTSHGARTQLGVGGKIDSKLSFSGGGGLMAEMQLFSQTEPRVAALYQNYGPHQAGHGSYNLSLAAFLVAMGNSSYWSFTETQAFDGATWECSNWAAVSRHKPDYARPLGPPVQPAMSCGPGLDHKPGVVDCARTFGTGTCAYCANCNRNATFSFFSIENAEIMENCPGQTMI